MTHHMCMYLYQIYILPHVSCQEGLVPEWEEGTSDLYILEGRGEEDLSQHIPFWYSVCLICSLWLGSIVSNFVCLLFVVSSVCLSRVCSGIEYSVWILLQEISQKLTYLWGIYSLSTTDIFDTLPLQFIMNGYNNTFYYELFFFVKFIFL